MIGRGPNARVSAAVAEVAQAGALFAAAFLGELADEMAAGGADGEAVARVTRVRDPLYELADALGEALAGLLPDPDEAVVHENGDELGARGDLQPGP